MQPKAPPAAGNWQQSRQQLQQLQSWQASGEIALITPKERHSAGLYWQHQPQQQQLLLSGPFGRQLLKATMSAEEANIVANGKQYRGPDASELLEQLTGWRLPLNRLPRWMVGLPAGANYMLNPRGRIASLTSPDGWQINYQSYQQVGAYVLPAALTASHGDTRIIMHIYHWTLGTH